MTPNPIEKSLGFIAYGSNRQPHWTSLTPFEKSEWDKVAEAVAAHAIAHDPIRENLMEALKYYQNLLGSKFTTSGNSLLFNMKAKVMLVNMKVEEALDAYNKAKL